MNSRAGISDHSTCCKNRHGCAQYPSVSSFLKGGHDSS